MNDKEKPPEVDEILKSIIEDYIDIHTSYHVVGQTEISTGEMLSHKTKFYDELYSKYILKSTADKQREEILKPIRDMFDKFKNIAEARESGSRYTTLMEFEAWMAINKTLEIADKPGGK